MKNIWKVLLISIIFYLFYSCENTSSDPDDNDLPYIPDTLSYVLDADGNPVANAKIVYTLDVNVYESDTSHVIVDPLPELTAMNFKDSFEIRYNVEFEENVSIWVKTDHIYDMGDTIIVLVNDRLLPGSYICYWGKKDSNDKYITNDSYQLWKYGGNSADSPYYFYRHVIYNYEDATEDEIHYLTSTDSDGTFDLNYIKLPAYKEPEYIVDDSTHSADLIGFRRFSEYVRLWAVKDGIENIYLDSVRLGYDRSVIIKPSTGK